MTIHRTRASGANAPKAAHTLTRLQVFQAVAAALDEQLYAPLDDFITMGSQAPLEQRMRVALRRHFEGCRDETRILRLIERVASYEPTLQATRVTRQRRYAERAADFIRQLQHSKLADPRLDPMLTAMALGTLTVHFREMWLVHGAVECTLERAVEQVSQIFINVLGLDDYMR